MPRGSGSSTSRPFCAGWASGEVALVPPIAELQRRQLVAARETLVEEMSAGAAALSRLCRDTAAMLEHARAVHGTEEDGAGLGPLHSALREAVVLLADCEAERDKLARVAGAVADTVRILLGHVEAVQEVEYKMRLLSLNAAVKCAQLGARGRALDVISQQLRALTGETVVSAHGAVEQLTRAADVATAFTGSPIGATADGVGALEREATAALSLFSAVSDRLGQALGELRRDTPIVARQLADAMDDLGRHSTLSEALSDAEIAVAELAAGAPSTPPRRGGRGQPALGPAPPLHHGSGTPHPRCLHRHRPSRAASGSRLGGQRRRPALLDEPGRAMNPIRSLGRAAGAATGPWRWRRRAAPARDATPALRRPRACRRRTP
jgi:hypothetical protein